jgi:hypothetical protein
LFDPESYMAITREVQHKQEAIDIRRGLGLDTKHAPRGLTLLLSHGGATPITEAQHCTQSVAFAGLLGVESAYQNELLLTSIHKQEGMPQSNGELGIRDNLIYYDGYWYSDFLVMPTADTDDATKLITVGYDPAKAKLPEIKCVECGALAMGNMDDAGYFKWVNRVEEDTRHELTPDPNDPKSGYYCQPCRTSLFGAGGDDA